MTLSCLGGGHDRAEVFGDARHRLLVVADAAGGASGAACAAELVVDLVRGVRARAEGPLGPVALRRLLERFDRVLLSHRRAGQSTCVLIEIVEDRFWGASVGDSGAWLVHGGQHIDLTAAQNRKWRLGTGLARPVSFGPLPLVGTLLVGTDGLFECATPEVLVDAVRPIPLSDVAGMLAARVRAPDGRLRDDLALVALRRAGGAAELDARAASGF